MKKIYTGLLLLLMLSLTACKRVSVTEEHHQLKNIACQNFGSSFVLPQQAIVKPLKNSLTREEAFELAVANNRMLQAQLQDIGIAKADLIQAGLYTNPLFAIVSNMPFQKNNSANYSITTSFALADLWQTPLREKIFYAQVQTAVYQMVQNILEIKVQVRKAYDAALYASNQLEQALESEQELKRQIGLPKERHDASAALARADLDVEAAQLKVTTACITLYTILGIDTFAQPTVFTDILEVIYPIVSLETLYCWALESRPELAAARWKIEQYKATVTYEKVRIVKDVNMGFSYAQDFTRNTGFGPEFDTHVPLFDQNQSAIARSRFLLEKSLCEYDALQLKIKAEVCQNYKTLMSTYKQIDVYKNQILPGYKAPVHKTSKQDAHNKLTEIYYNAQTVFADLERAVGRTIRVN